MSENLLRHLPSIDSLLRHEGVERLIRTAGRAAVRDRLREVLAEIRSELSRDQGRFAETDAPHLLLREIERRLEARLAQRQQARTQRVINATGVVLHTNLGRAPLSARALEAINSVAAGYCNIEYDLASGGRGRRGAGLAGMLGELFACEAAAIVNNCAAAVLITLNTLAEGGEVLVSRGELIEIGGSFRIPDVIAKSGARIREVGTTNRTRLSDFEAAITEQTRVILRAHPSNYRIVGFTGMPSMAETAALARRHNLVLFEDLGSGCLLDLAPWGIVDEPVVAQSLAAGVHIVSFSGDKLLGGPQAGIILGEAALIERIRKNPLMRALRVDKLTFAALEATVSSYVRDVAFDEIPVLAALSLDKATLARRARRFVRRARAVSDMFAWQVVDGDSVIGGGTTPEVRLPASLVSLKSSQASADRMEQILRRNSPPVITRIMEDQLIFDLRTVSQADETELLSAIGFLSLSLSRPDETAQTAQP